jgi:hypothetical protein
MSRTLTTSTFVCRNAYACLFLSLMINDLTRLGSLNLIDSSPLQKNIPHHSKPTRNSIPQYEKNNDGLTSF